MNIDRISINNRGIDRLPSTQGADQVRGGEKASSSAAQDSIALSSRAREMDRLANMVEQSGAERLNEVRQAVESGNYRVTGDGIAGKLIEFYQRK